MNTKGIKFLAVLAVLAMAFAAFAVIGDANDSDAAIESTKVADGSKGETYSIALPAETLKYASGAVSGVTPNNLKDCTDFAYDRNDYVAYGYAQIIIADTSNIKDGTTNADYVKITQENSAWKYIQNAPGDTSIDNEGMKRVKSYGFNTAEAHFDGESTGTLSFAIPNDGSSVKFTFEYYIGNPSASDSKKVATSTFSIDFSKTYTEVDLSKAIDIDPYIPQNKGEVNSIGWNYKKSTETLTLDNYAGNAVFKGAIKQVTLIGDNKIDAKGVSYAINSTSDSAMKIKPIEGAGSLEVLLDDAAATVDAISNATGVAIEGSSVIITVSSANDKEATVSAISAGTFSIYESSLNITLDPVKTTTGIMATKDIDVKSSRNITIDAKVGIDAGEKDVAIAASDVTIQSSDYGIKAGAVQIAQTTNLDVSAATAIAGAAAKTGMAVKSVSAESESVLTVDSLKISGAGSENNATINVTKDLIILGGANFENKSVLDVSGTLFAIGDFTNTAGTASADKIIISAVSDALDTEKAKITGGKKNAVLTGGEYYITSITLTKVVFNADFTASVEATITFAAATSGADEEPTDIYTKTAVPGTAILTSEGKLESMNLTLQTENADTIYQATIPVTFQSYVAKEATATDSAKIGYKYVIAASGNVYNADAAETEKVKVVGPSEAIVTPEGGAETGKTADDYKAQVLTEFTASQNFIISGGVVEAQDVAVNMAQTALVNGGELKAPITANAAVTIAKGSYNGDITAATDGANIIIAADAAMTGNAVINSVSNVDVNGTLTGNIVIDDKAIAIQILGSMDGQIELSGTYGKTAPADYKSVVDVDIKGKELTKFVTVAGTKNGTDDKAGYIAVDTIGAPKKGMTSSVIVTEGAFEFAGTATPMAIPDAFDFTAQSGATVSIKSGITVEISGAIVIQEGATFNIYDASQQIYNYGKITNDIVFTVSPNTYYCSLGYALTNAPEGTALRVSNDVENIPTAVAIKKDVTVTIAEGKHITFANEGSLTMAEGASIILEDNAYVAFGATPSKKVITGVFTYGDNKVIFTDVVLLAASQDETAQTAALNEIKAVKASATDATDVSKISVTAQYNAGSIELAAGTATGAITFADVTEGKNTTSGTFTIDADVKYIGTLTPSSKATIVIDGTYAVPTSGFTIIDGIAITGVGEIVITDGDLTIKDFLGAKTQAAEGADKVEPVKQNIKITDGTTTITFEDVFVTSADVIFHANKASGTDAANISISGERAVLNGHYTIVGNAIFATNMGSVSKTVITGEKDSVITIGEGKHLIIEGLLKIAGTLNVYVAQTATSYGTIGDNLVTYEDGDYTVYAPLAAAITEGGVTDFTVEEDLTVTGPADLGNVSLTVVEGKTLVITGVVSIGTAATTVGAGAVITGDVIVTGANLLIVYANADVTAANIYSDVEKKTKAPSSKYNIDANDELYCTVYTGVSEGKGMLFTDVEKNLSPEFTGYIFKGYTPYLDGAKNVGESDVAINLNAGKITITFTPVDGVTYYLDNVAMKTNSIQALAGQIVSASANPGYTGTVLVNGQASVAVSPSVTEFTATGAVPVDDGGNDDDDDDGFGLTEILLIVLVILIAVMCVILILRLNRS